MSISEKILKSEKTEVKTQSGIDSNEIFEFDIIGMSCNGCANSIKTYLENLNGIKSVEINFTSETGKVSYDSVLLNKEKIKKDVKSLGFEVSEDNDENETDKLKISELKKQKTKITVSVILSSLIMALSMREHFHFLNLNNVPENISLILLFILSSIVIFWCGSKFIKGAIVSLKNRSADMNTLITMGSMSSYIYSLVLTANILFSLNLTAFRNSREVFFETAAMIITFILIGNYLEAVMKSKTQTSILKLKNLQAKFVTIIRDGVEISVPFKKVRVNDIVLIKTGDKVPVDGRIIEGNCVVDESAMTGESLPVEKRTGDSLMSGTFVRNGFVKLNALKVGNETMLSKIISLVKDASNSKPKIQRLADRISAVFVPIVVLIAISTFLIWYVIIGAEFDRSLLFAVSVLIIACPCALGLASPIAIVIGVGRAAENGILFNNADAIENLVKVDTICFDKTGTLTTGKMQVKNIYVLNGITEDKLLKYVYSVEKLSNHPIAKSISEYCIDNGINPDSDIKNFSNETGLGVYAKVNNKDILIGNEKFIKGKGIHISEKVFQNHSNNLIVSIDGEISGVIEIEDRIKSEAESVIKEMKERNFELFMISGDSQIAATRTAKELDIENFSFKTLPDEKEKIISGLQSENKNVAMIGDGINDAPSLARSNVGFAIGSGQEIAIDSADIILVNDNLKNILKAIKLSGKTVSIIKQNFFWAFFYNAIAIPFAAGLFAPYGIIISPVMAAMIMAFSDVITVIGNSLRLKYFKLD
jgi:Cu+-exporting ATPase